MNGKKLIFIAMMMVVSAGATRADRYVSTNGLHRNGYLNWMDAATNIKAAVDVATDGQTVWLSNGIFAITGEISVTTAITIKGAFGREATLLAGGYPERTNRCFTINNTGACLANITISNFHARANGGGVYLNRGNITNCHLTHNRASVDTVVWGAGLYIANTWTTGLVAGCAFSHATNASFGGAIGASSGSTGIVRNCEFYMNYAGNGAAMFINGDIVVENCIMRDNSAVNGGVASVSAAGGQGLVYRNCLMIRNVVTGSGGALNWGSNSYSVINCTIVSNKADIGGGLNCSSDSTPGVHERFMNCIIYSNSASSYPNIRLQSTAVMTNWFFNSCVGDYILPAGQGNKTNHPAFVNPDPANPDYRLQANSPCIDAGSNQAWMAGAKDLDGRQRMDMWRRRVDMGAYEFLSGGMLFLSR